MAEQYTGSSILQALPATPATTIK
ncbi:hypothetical protein EYZ11_009740 [Aspergillus tanneri]|uniref:Uncharacterized protein n=1 Tax=Aspergillus tanneri TaxID=1220188 RepID=A0A4V3UNE6_9EURO|nr:hypothetical protein EYZ11_009740 [Aspergillus tanneri]